MIELTLLTQPDCGPCAHGKAVLDELSRDFTLHIREIDLRTEEGSGLAAEYRLMFAPGLIAGGRLVAHGRLSKRALRRDLARFIPNPAT